MTSAGGTEAKLRDYLKRVTTDLAQTRQRLNQVEREPIAIVGMACRYPGGVDSPDALWALVRDGVDAIGGFPDDRGWDLTPFEQSTVAFTREGGFLEGVADFDPSLFGISPNEALGMDPQQRLVLETSWEAIERAGVDPLSLRGSRTGVFTGVMYHEYSARALDIPPGVEGFLGTGSAGSVVSGRVAYALGLEGPAVSVDTACSSSLVAMHLAAQALRNGECSLALAGGVSVMVTPNTFVDFGMSGGLASDGRCKSFSASADGAGWAEGVGVLLLARLSDAERDGLPVLAVLRGSAVNSDGASSGLTVPNGPSQQRVIRAALANARLNTADIDAVEAHGTGTSLGDPIEAQAVLATYGQDRAEPLWLGSLKSNIGHAQSAAGVAGVIKMVLALRHDLLPRTLHADTATPHVDWAAGNVQLLTEPRPWPRGGDPRRAGISSFGVSGTNAHVIIEEYSAEAAERSGGAVPAVLPWVISGKTAEALHGQASRLLDHAQAAQPVDIARSLVQSRAALDHRAVVLGGSAEEFAKGLAGLAEGREVPGVVVRTGDIGQGGVVFVFPGQGAQWPGMVASLLETEPVFAARIEECAAALAPHVDWSLLDVLRSGDDLARVDVVQPVLWAVMVSLAELWRSAGVVPAAVVGHSQGEIAAAVVAGGLSLADGARVVALRSKAIAAGLSGGGMVSLALPESKAAELAACWPGVSVAAVNGPTSTVVSGDAVALDELVEHCTAADIRARRVPVDYASHSPHVDSLRERLIADLAPIRPRSGSIPFHSAVTATRVDTATLDAAYWFNNLREPVRFEAAVRGLLESGRSLFVEVSPHPVLTYGLNETVADSGTSAAVLATLRRTEGDTRRWLTALAEAHVHGVTVDWATLTQPWGGVRVDLPTYAFQRKRYWLNTLHTTTIPTSESWRYQLAWQPVALNAVKGDAPWAVVTRGDHPLAAAIAEHLGATVVDIEALDTLIQSRPGGVLSLLALEEQATAEYPAVPQGFADTITLIHALHAAKLQVPLWCATVDVATNPLQALVVGLGRVAAHEYPWWGGLVELPAEVDAQVLDGLAAALGQRDEDQLRLRPDGVHAARLRRADAPSKRRPWSPSGTALITGGTGAIGTHVARMLARGGAEHLLLLSRRGLAAPGAADLVAELEDLGARVTVLACDPADRDALAAVIAEHPPNSVFHAAGVVDSSILDSLTLDRVDTALRAKVTAAVNLHELTTNLDAFVLFSSLAGVFGAAGEGNYGPGNAFLDAFAHHRRAQGLPGTAIAWGSWDGAGMAEGAIGDAMARHGVPRMAPDLALDALRAAIDNDDTAVAIADIRWDTFGWFFTATRPSHLLDGLTGATDPGEAEPDEDQPLSQRLARVSAAERNRTLLALVREQVSLVLGYDSGNAVEPNRAFGDLGLASAGAVELRNRITLATGLRVPATLVFDHPTPAALARFLSAEITAAPVEPAAKQGTATAALVDDPIVIVGMSCRFPGGVRSPEDLWDLVVNGVDAMAPFPDDRGWDLAALYHPDPDNPGTTYAREGGFVDDATAFDAGLFGISPREAFAMDPQQRLLLEATWELFERAGIDPLSLRGSRTAVYAGTGGQDYMSFLTASASGSEGYLATGGSPSVVSGRVAYTFGLEGPALTVDTACSSSLVALHLAAHALGRGECDLAVVGGVTVLSGPGIFTEFSRQRGMSTTSRCRSFAASADGAGWGEGVGVLLVERLSDARRNGHDVLAVVRGTAINSDGASNGLTAPNGPAQQRVIRAALDSAALTPADIDAVEAHGTGTALGDPIEAQALLATYGQNRDEPLWLGSVKSNIGHTQAAAGVAGVIKAVMALHHGVLPATLHVDAPTPHVDWTAGAVSLLTDQRPWPVVSRPRRMAVSSFGISGTNAHTILEQAPLPDPLAHAPASQALPLPMLYSGDTAGALERQIAAVSLVDESEADVAWSLAATRADLSHRAVLVGGKCVQDVVAHGELVFLFTGQGSQRAGMGAELYAAFPVFAEAFDAVAERVDLDRPLLEAISDESVNQTVYTQAGLFALQVALFRLVESWGVVPDVLVGHSIGELAAAHVAGVLSLDDACALVSARGRLMQELPEGGAMLAVEAAESDLDLGAGVDLAAVNGPRSVVVSGDAAAVGEHAARWSEEGRRVKRLTVSHAFHSHRMEPMLEDFARVAEGLTYLPPQIPVVTTAPGAVDSADYWVRQVREPVRFADAVGSLSGVTTALELGPDGVLSALTQQIAANVVAVPALRPGQDEPTTLVAAVARLHARGVHVDWQAYLRPWGARRVSLPTYPFERDRYWPDPVPEPWFYRVEWQELSTAPSRLSGRWLVVGSEEIASTLRQAGATLAEDGQDGLAGVVVVVESAADVLAAARFDAPVWCVTVGAVSLAEEAPEPRSAAAWGIGRVAALEDPARWGGLIDVTDLADQGVVAALRSGEDQVAVRSGRLFGRRLRRAERPSAAVAVPTGTVLVTGGTGALGGHVARWLRSRGVTDLVLVSRRGPDAPGAAELAEEVGARVVACDLTDRTTVAELLARFTVSAVVHAAGVLDDGLVAGLTPDRLAAVEAAKAGSAELLDELIPNDALFVAFTSLAGVLGSPGQGAYAAANAYLDALVERRKLRGHPALSLAWGAWAGEGMAAAVADRLVRTGMRPMPVARALKALSDAWGQEGSLVVADIDWDLLGPGFTSARPSPLLSDLVHRAPSPQLPAEPSRRARGDLAAVVVELAASVLGHADTTAIEAGRPFRDLGFDSLTALELRNLLAAEIGVPLPAGLVFDHPTPAELAKHLAELVDQPTVEVLDRPTARAAAEPIAIVGMSCRFPGGVDSPEALWDLVRGGVDAMVDFPGDRGWDLDALGGSAARVGGFLDDIAGFDAGLFGISPREALAMDPQQRLLLEASWEVFERAGINPLSVRDSDIGVFAGTNGQDYATLLLGSDAAVEGHLGTGNTASVLSGRVSYAFGLRGPAITVDTACSSSLVALHLAARALRDGECSMALAGGITVMPQPSTFIEFSVQGGLAFDGRCKAFADGADGTGWGEGVGVLLLTRLSDAIAKGYRVLAVVRGSAVNQDGASNGLTAPNGPAQQRVIRAALTDARLQAADIDVVEAHGTGTALGDPIEAEALLSTYGRDRQAPLWLGSVKSNIGHTQAAAGVAGIIKMVMALRHRELPKTLHAARPTAHVDWSAGSVALLTENQSWQSEGLRRAAVSSFGLSGTNAHIIIEEYPVEAHGTARAEHQDLPWLLSARSAGALRDLAVRLGQVAADPVDVATTLASARAVLEHRAVVFGDYAAGLAALATGEDSPHLLQGVVRTPVVPAEPLADGWLALAQAHVEGVDIDWSAKAREWGGNIIDLPTYPFDRKRYWPDTTRPAFSADPGEQSFWTAVEQEDATTVADTLRVDVDTLTDLLPALSAWRKACRDKSIVDSWLYRVTWRPVELPAATLGGRWLVVTTDDGCPTDLVEVAPDATVVRLADGLPAGDWDGVLSLLAARDTITLLRTVDAPIWAVTRGAVSTGRADAPPDPEQALLWGLGRVAALEHPARWGGLIDLPATLDDRARTRLRAVLAGALPGEDQLAIRPAGVFARRLTRPSGSHRPEPTISGRVLITGGTGALGGAAARWLADHGVTDLLLVNRSGAQARDLVDDLAARGATAKVIACDVADRDALAALLAEHPVSGVVHSAGVATTVPLEFTSPDEFDDALSAKVLGARHLDELLPDAELFVLFSSIAGVWGSGGQASYSAANAYLDALAERRRAQGKAGAALAWGPWAGAGMAERAHDYLRKRGINPLRPDLAVAALALTESTTVADIDWARFEPSFTTGRPSPLLAEFATVTADAPVVTGIDGIRELVCLEVAGVLGYPEPVAADVPFTDLGVDSLTAVQVRDRIAAATGVRLPSTLVFDYPTPDAVADELVARIGGIDTEVAAPVVVADDAIAIVAMSCRFPGGATSPEALWDLVANGVDALSAFPDDRGWDLSAAGEITAEGGFVHDATDFDAELFGISPREAAAMDPQQRLLLESTWELLERAGIAPDSLRGSTTGVFVGASASGYGAGGVLPAGSEGHAMTGTSNSVLSGRVAYSFGLEGPAVTVDTACSSSLVALHLAAQALRSGDCALAVAGGVAVMPTPTVFAEFSRQGGLATSGRCRSFAESADGTGWGEGVGLLLVERLSDARRNGHQVLAVVRGSAVNSDGASNGLTAPNGPSQQRVIRAALAGAGLAHSEVDAVEAHGTGTALGDPVEAQALLATYGRDRAEPLWLGSVKSNIGHTQAAAGAAGIIKMVEAIRRGVLPGTLHVDEPASHVDWDSGAVRLLTSPRPWPEVARPRRAGVSSFGMSGTNAHVILEGVQEAPVEPEDGTAPTAVPWVVSGRSDTALRAQAQQLLTVADHDLVGVSRALATERARLPHRAVVLAGDAVGVRRGLTALAEGRADAAVVRGTAGKGGLAYLFSGQGAQRAGMGKGLYAAFPAYADAFDAVCAHLDLPLHDIIDTESVHEATYTQTGLFAVEVALFRLLESWGLKPDVLAGHSFGELAAAHVAGILSLQDACTLVSARARLTQGLPEGGAMLAVRMTETEVLTAIQGHQVDIAAINARDSVVLSGDADVIDELEALARSSDRQVKRLRTARAFHSHRMEPMVEPFAEVARSVTYGPAKLPIVSTLTGQLDTGDMSTPDYWIRQIRSTVRFADAIRALRDRGATKFLEIGPDSQLTALADQTLTHPGDTRPATAVAAQRAGKDEAAWLVSALAALHVNGQDIAWDLVLRGWGGRRVDLPTYAFQRKRYWVDAVGTATATEQAPAPLAATSTLELVQAATARVLGHADPAAVEVDREFLELGLDSLTALDLRALLREETGVDLPASIVFDHPTPADLARHLEGEPTAGTSAGLLEGLYREAMRTGRVSEFLKFLGDAAKFRPAADRLTEITSPARRVALANGDAPGLLLCCSGLTAGGGPHEFARLAAALRGKREVAAIPLLGYARDDLLPSTQEVALDWLADAVPTDTPVYLLGHSGGATLAHSLASRLAALGRPPAGLVLVDIYPLDHPVMTEWAGELSEGVFERRDQYVPMDDARLTAMAWYGRLFWQVPDPEPAIPTLLVRAAEPLGEATGEWRSSWPGSSTVDVQGNHFTMMSEHAGSTAAAVHHWIAALVGEQPHERKHQR
ncbi:type I polyketide synthase [Actinokineospora terrae]|uniref:6-deoxyerythronolide-B synthase n=1 Tax=Actinokineospora terrae TaxID=155974 RepID=A0A1H9P382_9PSEU|nr:type I polyketide synthase [Actinokineospora terrae]SER42581.1 Acyl transferase domain-containing protein [Actinokineospora terrae]